MGFLSLVCLFCLTRTVTGPPEIRGELIFPLEKKHNHGSCIVECPNGDLFVCWYNGSGERTADDVRILGARLRRDDRRWTMDDGNGAASASRPEAAAKLPDARSSVVYRPSSVVHRPSSFLHRPSSIVHRPSSAASGSWSKPFELADTPGFPDCNPCMIVDPAKRLWLFWPVILDNHWESALMKYQVSEDYQRSGAPRWNQEKALPLKPGPEFAATLERDLDAAWEPARKAATPELQSRLKDYLARLHTNATDKLKVRLGWMPRVHPFIDGNRMIVTLYSDGFDFSLMAITDDWGKTWTCSAPIVGAGNVQPSIAKRRDGTLVAFFRDNGPPPKRTIVCESKDRGMTWSAPRDIEVPNPGSGLEVCVLKSGKWLLVYNDTERRRNSLAVSVSQDEGRSWTLNRHIEQDADGADAGSYSYPSIIQVRDGTIHVTYSYSPNKENGKGQGESIKHVQFQEAWLMHGK